MASLDVKNAFGSIFRETVLKAVAERAPRLIHYLTRAWPVEGTPLWAAGPGGWAQLKSQRGVLQGSPLSAILFAVGLDWILSSSAELGKAQRLLYADDITMWGPVAALRAEWPTLLATMAQAGLQIQPKKCQSWRPH